MFKYKTGHFENDSGTQSLNGFCQQTLKIASGILKAMKSVLNMFTHTAQKPVKFGRILEGLVGAFGCPDAIASELAYIRLPIISQKAFVSENVASLNLLQDDLSGLAFISVGGHQVIDKRQAIQSGQHDQFVAKVIQIP